MQSNGHIFMLKRLFSGAVKRLGWASCRLFPINKKKIVVSSYFGKGYGDNPKYIVDELLAHASSYKIIWLVKDKQEMNHLPDSVKACKINTWRSIYHMSTAKVWIDNCRRPYGFKRKSQFYLQTWHGFALKRIEGDVCDKLSPGYIRLAQKDSAAIDLIVSDSRFMSGIYQSSFWYSGDVVEWGSPRNDIIINGVDNRDLKQKVYARLHMEGSPKTILYAPTFRSNHSLEPYSLDYDRVVEACEKKFGGNFKVLLRLHPNISQMSHQLKVNPELVIDASGYDDMQELLAVADIVITDYSSLMFDFALSDKPVFQFATDIDDYKGDRNFYFQLDELPFSIAQSNEELVRNIGAFRADKYKQSVQTFFDSVGMVRDGDSAKKCAELIDERMKK